jgi:hypothetical protein
MNDPQDLEKGRFGVSLQLVLATRDKSINSITKYAFATWMYRISRFTHQNFQIYISLSAVVTVVGAFDVAACGVRARNSIDLSKLMGEQTSGRWGHLKLWNRHREYSPSDEVKPGANRKPSLWQRLAPTICFYSLRWYWSDSSPSPKFAGKSMCLGSTPKFHFEQETNRHKCQTTSMLDWIRSRT